MSYRKVDLNPFALFDTMLKQRSVSAAARELGVTASAVELAPSIQDGLGRLATALEERAFNPAETTRTFVIATTDYATTLILPDVINRMAVVAPHLHIKIFPFGRLDVVQQLDEGRLQVVLGWFDTLPNRIKRQTLMTEQEAIVVRSGHPLTAGAVTEARLLSFPHVVVEVTGSEDQGQGGFLDERGVMRRVWIERLLIETHNSRPNAVGRVAVTVPHYFEVPGILAATDMVATLPRRLALRAAAYGGLVVLDLPYEPLVVRHKMIWHERAAADPGMRWLLGQIEAAAERLVCA